MSTAKYTDFYDQITHCTKRKINKRKKKPKKNLQNKK